MVQLQRRTPTANSSRILSAIRTCLPGAWFSPSSEELLSVYFNRYQMAMDEKKYDVALVFLNKAVDVDPHRLELKLLRAELYHRHLNDLKRALDGYNKVIRMADRDDRLKDRARTCLTEIIEMVS